MKHFVLFCAFFPFLAISQVNDNFSDGDFLNNPSWNGDNSQFIVNTSDQLQLNSTGTDTSALSIPNTFTLSSTRWNFWVKLSFSPSDNNNMRVYLVADQTNLKGALNGYFIRMGENGSFDSVDLWKQSGSTETKIIDGINGHVANSNNTVRIKVIRDNIGNWSLYSDTLGGTNYALEGSVNDITYINTSFFGVYCKYTTSNSTKMYFDDFYAGPVIVDTTAPYIDSLKVLSSTRLDIFFNEPVDTTSAKAINNYYVDKGIGAPILATPDVSNNKLVHLTFSNAFINGSYQELTTTNVKDILSNAIISIKDTFLYSVVSPFDIVINEVMYEPKDNGVEFVEIYNRSNKIIDLKSITLSSMDTIAGILTDVKNIAAKSRILFPKEYVVISTNSSAIKAQYYTPNTTGFIDIASIPSLNNDGDVIVIADRSMQIIDKFIYTPAMHFSLLNDTKGVSLERLNFDRLTNDKTNWHSAATTAGYATPAYQNSQFVFSETATEVEVEPEVFSPDNDGYKDVVNISYLFDASGYVGNITVFDSQGLLIKRLKKNEIMGNKGSFAWDGLNDNKEKASIGIYIIYFEAFNQEGNIKKYKKTCVLAQKLN